MAVEPLVCAIMLTRDRPEMATRAAKSFFAQTYQNKKIFVFDSGDEPLNTSAFFRLPGAGSGMVYSVRGVDNPNEYQCRRGSIGHMRNKAAETFEVWNLPVDIIIHWDDDDYSHPNRIAEQVALLQASKKQCVGYREMLFWRECATCQGGRGNMLPRCPECGIEYDPNRAIPVGEAWLYRHPSPKYCLGTSLCYWREVWQQRPFQDLPQNNCATGEDTEWLKGVDSMGIFSLVDEDGSSNSAAAQDTDYAEPRMIATIHGGNTMHYGSVLEESTSWQRVPAWDEYCRGRMAL
jgi:hypothetical protein